jgi:hypothetical protein
MPLRLVIACITVFAILGCSGEAPPMASEDNEMAQWMEKFKNRKIYDQLTINVLATIPDTELEQAVIDYVGTKIGDDYAREREIVARLSPGVRALYITWWVEAEVNNGGFNQYYWNSAGQFADDAPSAFEYFAAHQHADLMRQANAVRSVEAAAIQKYKDKGTIEAFSASYKESQLDPLDKQFYALSENLSTLRIAKIRSSPSEFTGT